MDRAYNAIGILVAAGCPSIEESYGGNTSISRGEKVRRQEWMRRRINRAWVTALRRQAMNYRVAAGALRTDDVEYRGSGAPLTVSPLNQI
jgi:hypothetical protein